MRFALVALAVVVALALPALAHNGEVHDDALSGTSASSAAAGTSAHVNTTSAGSTGAPSTSAGTDASSPHDHSMSTTTGSSMDHSAAAFILSNSVTVLFKGFTTKSSASFFGALVFTFSIVVIAQALGAYKRQIERSCAKGCSCLTLCACSVLHGCHVGIDLMVMLIAMTFNVGLFLAIIAGTIVGHAVIMKRVYPVLGILRCGRVGEEDCLHDEETHGGDVEMSASGSRGGGKSEEGALPAVAPAAGFVDVSDARADIRPRHTSGALPAPGRCAH
eukprot:tig00001094_g6983.t1